MINKDKLISDILSADFTDEQKLEIIQIIQSSAADDIIEKPNFEKIIFKILKYCGIYNGLESIGIIDFFKELIGIDDGS